MDEIQVNKGEEEIYPRIYFLLLKENYFLQEVIRIYFDPDKYIRLHRYYLVLIITLLTGAGHRTPLFLSFKRNDKLLCSKTIRS